MPGRRPGRLVVLFEGEFPIGEVLERVVRQPHDLLLGVPRRACAVEPILAEQAVELLVNIELMLGDLS